MVRIGGAVNGLVAQAKRAAQRRGQRPSTGHILLVMVQGRGEAGRILSSRAVRETDLLSALKVVDDEASSALEVALERAQRLASALGEPEARPLHLLLAIARDARTTGHRCLERLGSGAGAIAEEVTAMLGMPASSARSAGPGSSSADAPPGHPGSAPRLSSVKEGPPPRIGLGPAGRGRTPLDPRAHRRGRTATPKAVPADPVPEPTAEGDAAPVAPSPEPAPTPPRNVRVVPRRSPEGGPFDLPADAFPLLSALGRNLTAEAAAGVVDPVFGREREVEALLDVLARRRSNNPLVVGPPGVGKTAVVEALARRLVDGGEGVHGLTGRILVEVSAGSLVSGTGVRGALAERVRQLREEVARSEGRVVLFIDEIHAIVGGEGPDDLASELKASLARGELPCIGATTEAEYRKYFERDPALCRRFSAIHVDEPSPPDAVRILKGVAPRYEIHHAVAYAPEALEAAVELSVRYLPERHLPDKAISAMDMAAARVRRRGGAIVDAEAVASVISELARVPVDRLLMRDADRLLSLEARLAERVVGHGACMGRIADALRKGAAGFRGRRPLGTFLLLGPTGVGKTETAKAVADLLFAGGAMTRLDMSEFSEAHAVARLLGAPPGYIGHQEGGQLTEPVRRRPYQLVLLDEVEKAHPQVLLSLLPLLDEGRLTDGRGRTVDFTNTVVFMTSNLGSGAPAPERRMGFGPAAVTESSAEQQALAAARAAVPPELWNRIDEPLWFGPLGRDEVAEIARRMLRSVAAALEAAHGVILEVDPSAIDSLIAGGGYDPALGARPMRRVVGRMVEAPLAARVLERSLGARVRLYGSSRGLCFEPALDAAE
jgi:ATP-dependent Clp protease ATP-binding subunit ClpC